MLLDSEVSPYFLHRWYKVQCMANYYFLIIVKYVLVYVEVSLYEYNFVSFASIQTKLALQRDFFLRQGT